MTQTAWIHSRRVFSRAELRYLGYTRALLAHALHDGEVSRLRRDSYTVAETSGHNTDRDDAVRAGGRLSCVSRLAELGVFAVVDARLHVRVARNAGRRRGTRTTTGYRPPPLCWHWAETLEAVPDRDAVSLRDALRDALRCAPPRYAIAMLDSILHQRLLTRGEVEDVLRTLPLRCGVLLALTDARAESGPETLVRLILRQLGAEVELQVRVAGVGRVDLLVDGWLIVECDSRQFHSEWRQVVTDRRRDLAAAELGYTTVRLLAADILSSPDAVRESLRRVLAASRGSV